MSNIVLPDSAVQENFEKGIRQTIRDAIRHLAEGLNKFDQITLGSLYSSGCEFGLVMEAMTLAYHRPDKWTLHDLSCKIEGFLKGKT